MNEHVHTPTNTERSANEADYRCFEESYDQQEHLRAAIEKVLGSVYVACGGKAETLTVRLRHITQNSAYAHPYGVVVHIDARRIAQLGSVPKPVTDLYRALKHGFLSTNGVSSGLSCEGDSFALYGCHASVGKLVKAVDRTIYGMNVSVPYWQRACPQSRQTLLSLNSMLGLPGMEMREQYKQ